jgi:hypothetical protein
LFERRKGKRFQVGWPIRVRATNSRGMSFIERGTACNISSGGALLRLRKRLPAGAKLDVYIQLPTKSNRWMKYAAHVVRIEGEKDDFSAAVKFDTAMPQFAES